jgi:hypothetical protein
LNWNQFKWRNHQPDIGRFFNVDPLSEKYVYNSPYAFSENRVVDGVELEGLEWSSIKDDESKTIANTVQIKVRNSSNNLSPSESMALAMDIENKAEEVLSGKGSDGYTHITVLNLWPRGCNTHTRIIPFSDDALQMRKLVNIISTPIASA